MISDLPKVAHKVGGRSMVCWVVDAARAVGCAPVVLVVGHQADVVRGIFKDDDSDLRYVVQSPQLGTAHAVDQARSILSEPGVASGNVFVLCGDGPLIRAETLERVLTVHHTNHAAATLATSTVADPTGYGRIKRDSDGRFLKIVEHKDASAEEKSIREVNPSYYCFCVPDLLEALRSVSNQNAKGEYYLTDVFEILLAAGKRVEVVDAVPPEDVLSVNTPEQLAQVEGILESRGTPSGAHMRSKPTARPMKEARS